MLFSEWVLFYTGRTAGLKKLPEKGEVCFEYSLFDSS